jgi:hypothetical protein
MVTVAQPIHVGMLGDSDANENQDESHPHCTVVPILDLRLYRTHAKRMLWALSKAT